MKRFFALLVLSLVVMLGSGRAGADGTDDLYLRIYGLIQEADALSNRAEIAPALAKYNEAQTALQSFQQGYPQWNPKVVSFRLEYLAGKISELSAKMPASALGGGTNGALTNLSTLTPAPVVPAKPAAPDDWLEQLNGWKAQAGLLQSDKSALEAKLKEALAVRPAAIDPGELTKAQEKLKTLQKENDLLKAALEQQKAKSTPGADPKALKQAQQTLTEAQQQLASQQDLVARLQSENEQLRRDKAALEARAKAAATASAPAAATFAPVPAAAAPAVAVSAPAPAPAPTVAKVPESKRMRELKRERDELQDKLKAAQKALDNRKDQAAIAHAQELEDQIAHLRARLDTFEARQVPFTTEELALLQRPAPKPSEPEPSKKSVKDLPPATAALIVEARRHFSGGEYEQAETNYLQVLSQDSKNVPAMANLAAIQIERGHFDEAQTNLQQALALSPNDAYALSVLGMLKFRQAKYDEALDALSRAAKLDPHSAEIQNYLGLTLSEKGLRVPAETALRKAVELEPGYASAHNNLAVIYLSQQPPAIELARWHYQRARAAGSPANPELEKMLEAKTASAAAKTAP